MKTKTVRCVGCYEPELLVELMRRTAGDLLSGAGTVLEALAIKGRPFDLEVQLDLPAP